MSETNFIKLTYRMEIDSSAQDDFSKAAARLSHEEFRRKSQSYNPEGQFNTFSQMKANDGRANSLHYKCSFSVSGLVGTLNNKIPQLTDLLGRQIDFETFSFELIESDLNDISQHKFAINFITHELKLIMNAGETLVLEKHDAVADGATGFTDCFSLQLKNGLEISAYRAQ